MYSFHGIVDFHKFLLINAFKIIGFFLNPWYYKNCNITRCQEKTCFFFLIICYKNLDLKLDFCIVVSLVFKIKTVTTWCQQFSLNTFYTYQNLLIKS